MYLLAALVLMCVDVMVIVVCIGHDLNWCSVWYSVLDTVVISGEDVCCSVVFGTLVVV